MKHTTILIGAMMIFPFFGSTAQALAVPAPASVFAAAEAKPKLTCTVLPKTFCDQATQPDSTTGGGILNLLTWIINIVTSIVGIAAVAAFIWAGVLYSSAGGSSESIVKAKKVMSNTAIGIAAYAVMYFVTMWLVPGGVF